MLMKQFLGRPTHIFVETIIQFFRMLYWTESSKEQHLFAIFCNMIIHVFTIPFDQSNASLLNKCILISFKKYWPQTFELYYEISSVSQLLLSIWRANPKSVVKRILSNSSRTKNRIIWASLSNTIFLCKRIRKKSQHLQRLYQIWLFVNLIRPTRLLNLIFCHIAIYAE